MNAVFWTLLIAVFVAFCFGIHPKKPCPDPYQGPNCTTYAPRRHCADLVRHWGLNTSGTALIRLGEEYKSNGEIIGHGRVVPMWCQCDTPDDCGWTLISGGNFVSDLYRQYVRGFGDPTTQETFVGLENIHLLTRRGNMNLKAELIYCDKLKGKQTLYHDKFVVLDRASQYALVTGPAKKDSLPETLGWPDQNNDGIKFEAVDNVAPNHAQCMKNYTNSGWWYGDKCAVNIHAPLITCAKEIGIKSMSYFVEADDGIISHGEMYVRPKGYPDYPVYND